MNITTNPDCPDKATVREQAEALAAKLREEHPDREIKVVECLLSHFQVQIKFPFRNDHRRWDEPKEEDA